MPVREQRIREGFAVGQPYILSSRPVETGYYVNTSVQSPEGSVVLVYNAERTRGHGQRIEVNYYGPVESDGALSAFWAYAENLTPMNPPTMADSRRDRRNLRAKLQARLETYRAVEKPTPAVQVIVEELEGALSL